MALASNIALRPSLALLLLASGQGHWEGEALVGSPGEKVGLPSSYSTCLTSCPPWLTYSDSTLPIYVGGPLVAVRRLFASADDGDSSTLSHLVGIYVERSSLLWKIPDALDLLWQVRLNCVSRFGRSNSSDLLGGFCDSTGLS